MIARRIIQWLNKLIGASLFYFFNSWFPNILSKITELKFSLHPMFSGKFLRLVFCFCFVFFSEFS